MPTLLDVTFDTPLHPGQQEVLDHPARFKVLACGRRWGKTMLGGLLVVKRAVEGEAVWYVAPNHKLASRGWREIKELAVQVPGTKILESGRRIEFVSGGWLEVRSAHDENALRGEGLDFLLVDEAAFMRETTWTAELRPSLADNQGDALIISTFDGENYFYDLYERGQNPNYPAWASWRFSTETNPFIDPAEIAEAKATTPHAAFEQEWMANPLVYVGAVFDGESVQRASERGVGVVWSEDLATSAGLDWGHNTTAFEVCQEDAEERVHWLEERIWHAVELNVRCAAIVEICRERNVEVIYADAAGASEIMTLDGKLRDAGLKTQIQPIPFNKYKDDGIMTRQYYLERGLETIGPGCPQLLKDSKRYHYKENSDDVVKENDHTVDAGTAFYAWRRDVLMGLKRSA